MKYGSKHPLLKDQDANVIGLYIEKKFPDGVTPEQLVEAATPKRSPIHKYFEWNDRKAAKRFRLQQARLFIGALVVTVNEKPIKAFHHVYVSDAKSSSYQSLKDAAADSDLWEQVVNDALRELVGWRDRFNTYKEFKGVVSEIAKLERKTRKNGNKESSRKKVGTKKAKRRKAN